MIDEQVQTSKGRAVLAKADPKLEQQPGANVRVGKISPTNLVPRKAFAGVRDGLL